MATFVPNPDLDPTVAHAIQAAMDSLRTELLEQLSTGTATTATGGRAGTESLLRLETAISAIDGAGSQVELLGTLLEQAGAFAERTLFLVRDGAGFKGWAAYGFDSTADVADLAVDGNLDASSQTAIGQFMGGGASESLSVPFMLRGQVAGALYADRRSAQAALDGTALRILTYVAAQALETLPLRHSQESPQPPAAAPPEPAAPEESDAEFDRAIQGITPEQDVVASEDIVEIRRGTQGDPGLDSSASETVELGSAGYETAVPVSSPPAIDDGAELDVELPAADQLGAGDAASDFGLSDTPEITESPDQAFATQEISTLETKLGDGLDIPIAKPKRSLEPSEVAPPTDHDGPGWAFGGAESITEDTRHEEARRLARLLVTEIKLYNEEKVREGREKGNIVDQLRDDLERSRRIFEERIDEEVRRDTDYFQEECLRILAGGDSAVLGS